MAYVENPLQFQRVFPQALDINSTFATTAERLAFLTNPIRYVGQIVSDQQDGKVYKLNLARNAWEPIGGTEYNQSLNTTDNVEFNNITVNNIFENVGSINTGAPTRAPLSGTWLDGINNISSSYGPYNVLVDTQNQKYVPIDVTRGDALTITLSTVAGAPLNTAYYHGFILVNNETLVHSSSASTANTTISAFIPDTTLINKLFTVTIFLKHEARIASIPWRFHNGSITTNASGSATAMNVQEYAVKWSGGCVPDAHSVTLTATNEVVSDIVLGAEDILTLMTRDGGVSWYGFIGALNMTSNNCTIDICNAYGR